ncbi:PTS glucose transporter subunit IIA [Shewanella sp. NFH-SH190041]|uniref:PTS glucose transporter subunit IIA n=1 Tax=Shewanella sp. NFH-SH190041 TaxID=2950245 RepID=UPI0021C47535|nr:PTS glucose transporter subunit IIA [Shewanella sp. NFH-SH190041]BDM64779.1 PTS glucose transporter subunit IIA [Shewanella sp. NFH-SH190041]
MGFFSRIRRMISAQPPVEGSIAIYAPISGEVVPLSSVPDSIFADKVVGDGVAIAPTGDTLYAPIAGTLAKIFDSNHAFSIETPQGIELFVHFGVGTVELGGKGFTRLIEPGCQVNVGDPIIGLDLDYLRQEIPCILTPVVIANMEDIATLQPLNGHVTVGKQPIFSVTMQ